MKHKIELTEGEFTTLCRALGVAFKVTLAQVEALRKLECEEAAKAAIDYANIYDDLLTAVKEQQRKQRHSVAKKTRQRVLKNALHWNPNQ